MPQLKFTYVAAVRRMHVSTGLHEFFDSKLTPQLQHVLRGIKKHQALTHSSRVRLPITLQIMYKIKEVLSQELKICYGQHAALPFLGSCDLANLRSQVQMITMCLPICPSQTSQLIAG